MGKVIRAKKPLRTFVGVATSQHGEPPTLNEALESAAGAAIRAGVISSTRTAWFDLTAVEVELGNQHPRTLRVKVTEQETGR